MSLVSSLVSCSPAVILCPRQVLETYPTLGRVVDYSGEAPIERDIPTLGIVEILQLLALRDPSEIEGKPTRVKTRFDSIDSVRSTVTPLEMLLGDGRFTNAIGMFNQIPIEGRRVLLNTNHPQTEVLRAHFFLMNRCEGKNILATEAT